jgi:hypothetical protein
MENEVNIIAMFMAHAILSGPMEQNEEVTALAKHRKCTVVQAVAAVSYDFAEAMISEGKTRGYL